MSHTKSHKNCMIVGESGTGKTLLCSVLSNPQRDEGHYFLDPDFEGGNIRLNEQHGVSFVDTKPLTFNEEDTRQYLTSLLSELRRNQLRITGWIFCIRYGRIKADCVRLLQVVQSIAKTPVTVFISNCQRKPDFITTFLKSQCGIENFYWMKAEVTEDIDDHLGRWIVSSSQLDVVRDRILQRYGV